MEVDTEYRYQIESFQIAAFIEKLYKYFSILFIFYLCLVTLHAQTKKPGLSLMGVCNNDGETSQELCDSQQWNTYSYGGLNYDLLQRFESEKHGIWHGWLFWT